MGPLDLLKYLFDVYLDVLDGYVGYHSWDVTLGQIAASDFYVVSVVVVHASNGRLIYGEAFLRAGVGEPTGFRVHQAVLFHSLLASLQASPNNENSNLDWRHNLHPFLRLDLCAQYILFDTASGGDLCYTFPESSCQRWITSFCSICCCRAVLRSRHYHHTYLWRLPASALRSAEVEYQSGLLDWRLVSIRSA